MWSSLDVYLIEVWKIQKINHKEYVVNMYVLDSKKY